MKQTLFFLFGLLALAIAGATQAGTVSIPNTFTAGTPAKAAEVNANFVALKTAHDGNDSRISKLEADNAMLKADNTTLKDTVSQLQSAIATLQSQMAKVNSSQVMALDPYLTVDTVGDSRGPLVKFTGVNLQIVNGIGYTASSNGLGNLIIGYDEADTSGVYHCSIGTDSSTNTAVTDPTSCSNAGGAWSNTGFKNGSHYLVMGSGNNYSQFGGIVAGQFNTSNYGYASISSGKQNTASGYMSSVSGGNQNFAGGPESSVSGGFHNFAFGTESSISGGNQNATTGTDSSISGGSQNTSSGLASSVSGGNLNAASGDLSSVSGGDTNEASGQKSSVSGGTTNTASGTASSVLGGLSQSEAVDNGTLPALP